MPSTRARAPERATLRAPGHTRAAQVRLQRGERPTAQGRVAQTWT